MHYFWSGQIVQLTCVCVWGGGQNLIQLKIQHFTGLTYSNMVPEICASTNAKKKYDELLSSKPK